jgi:hypothetical protein
VDVLNMHGRVLVVAHTEHGFEVLAGDDRAAEAGHPDHSRTGIEA